MQKILLTTQDVFNEDGHKYIYNSFLRTGTFNLVTGEIGSGKTSFLFQFLEDMRSQNFLKYFERDKTDYGKGLTNVEIPVLYIAPNIKNMDLLNNFYIEEVQGMDLEICIMNNTLPSDSLYFYTDIRDIEDREKYQVVIIDDIDLLDPVLLSGTHKEIDVKFNTLLERFPNATFFITQPAPKENNSISQVIEKMNNNGKVKRFLDTHIHLEKVTTNKTLIEDEKKVEYNSGVLKLLEKILKYDEKIFNELMAVFNKYQNVLFNGVFNDEIQDKITELREDNFIDEEITGKLDTISFKFNHLYKRYNGRNLTLVRILISARYKQEIQNVLTIYDFPRFEVTDSELLEDADITEKVANLNINKSSGTNKKPNGENKIKKGKDTTKNKDKLRKIVGKIISSGEEAHIKEVANEMKVNDKTIRRYIKEMPEFQIVNGYIEPVES